jgi:hypothetical protein
LLRRDPDSLWPRKSDGVRIQILQESDIAVRDSNVLWDPLGSNVLCRIQIMLLEIRYCLLNSDVLRIRMCFVVDCAVRIRNIAIQILMLWRFQDIAGQRFECAVQFRYCCRDPGMCP